MGKRNGTQGGEPGADGEARTVAIGKNGRAQVRRVRPNGLTMARRQRFLDMLAATGNVQRSAAEVDASPQAFYKLRQKDAGFAAAWRDAAGNGYELLEDGLLALALGGGDPGARQVGNATNVDPGPMDKELALELIRLRDARARGGGSHTKGINNRHVALAEVERVLVERIKVLEKRMGFAR